MQPVNQLPKTLSQMGRTTRRKFVRYIRQHRFISFSIIPRHRRRDYCGVGEKTEKKQIFDQKHQQCSQIAKGNSLSDRLVYIILNYPVWFKKNEGEIWRLTMILNKEECIQQITIQINCNRRQRIDFSTLKAQILSSKFC
jgi:hypothetical protein